MKIRLKFNHNILKYLTLILFLVLSNQIYSQTGISELKNKLITSSGTVRIDILINLAFEYQHIPDSLSYFSKKALKEAEKLEYPKGIAEAKALIGYSYALLEQFNISLDLLNESISKLDHNASNLILSVAYNARGNIYRRNNLRDKAKADYEKALESARKSGSLKEEVKTYLNFSRLAWIESDFDTFIEVHSKALKINKNLNNKEGIAVNLNSLGAVYWQKAYFETSMRYYYEALKIREEMKDSSNMIVVLNNIGLGYVELNDAEKAVLFIKRALNISKKLDDTYRTGYGYNCLGKAYEKLSRLDSARIFFMLSLNYYIKSKEPAGIAFASMDMGRMDNILNKPDEALNLFRNSIDYYKKIGNKKKLAEAYKNTGISYLLLKDYKTAGEFLSNSLSLANDIGQRGIVRDVYEQFSILYKATGDYRKALDYNLKFGKMKDSLDTDDHQKSLGEIHTKYELEKKNLQLKNKEYEIEKKNLVLYISITIILLLLVIIVVIINYVRVKSNKNQELKKAYNELNLKTQALDEALKTKDKFFSIIAHDLKNPFHNILSITDLMHTQRDILSREDEKEFIQSLYHSSRDTYELLENLLTWSLTQRKSLILKNELVNIKELIFGIISTLTPLAAKKNITICTKVDDINFECDRNALNTIMHNLLMNAIKFSYLHKKISVSAYQQNSSLIINVEDEGMGMNAQTKENLFRLTSDSGNKGTNNESGTGLGLIICKELIDLMNGDIKVESETNKGTKFSLTLKQK